MKKLPFTTYLNIGLQITLMFLLIFFASCKKEESIIPDDTSDKPTYPVAAGKFLAKIDTDTTITTTMELKQTLTAKPGGGFGENDYRDGFSSVVLYIEAGEYMIVDIADDQTISKRYGGTTTSIDSANAPVPGGWMEIDMAEDGDSFTVGTSGIYQVFYDQTYSVGFVVKIDQWYMHGDATEPGWSQVIDEWVKLEEVTATAEGASWSATGVVLRASESANKYILPRYGLNIEYADDLPLFTFFGGEVASSTLADLEDTGGGDNLVWSEEGTYDITIDLVDNDLTVAFTRTGDAPAEIYDPVNYSWGLVGPAAGDAEWDGPDVELTFQDWPNDGKGSWTGLAYLEADQFVIRANEAWDLSLNAVNSNFSSDAGIEDADPNDDYNNNFLVPTEGFYYVRVTTDDEGVTWNVQIDAATFALVGDATPGLWDINASSSLTSIDVSGAIAYKASALSMTTGEFLVVVNGAYEVKIGYEGFTTIDGVSSNEISQGGGYSAPHNIAVATDGTYDVTITTDDKGSSWTLTFD